MEGAPLRQRAFAVFFGAPPPFLAFRRATICGGQAAAGGGCPANSSNVCEGKASSGTRRRGFLLASRALPLVVASQDARERRQLVDRTRSRVRPVVRAAFDPVIRHLKPIVRLRGQRRVRHGGGGSSSSPANFFAAPLPPPATCRMARHVDHDERRRAPRRDAHSPAPDGARGVERPTPLPPPAVTAEGSTPPTPPTCQHSSLASIQPNCRGRRAHASRRRCGGLVQ